MWSRSGDSTAKEDPSVGICERGPVAHGLFPPTTPASPPPIPAPPSAPRPPYRPYPPATQFPPTTLSTPFSRFLSETVPDRAAPGDHFRPDFGEPRFDFLGFCFCLSRGYWRGWSSLVANCPLYAASPASTSSALVFASAAFAPPSPRKFFLSTWSPRKRTRRACSFGSRTPFPPRSAQILSSAPPHSAHRFLHQTPPARCPHDEKQELDADSPASSLVSPRRPASSSLSPRRPSRTIGQHQHE